MICTAVHSSSCKGFGVCCIFEQTTCGGTVTENCTYVQNPGFPTAYNPGTEVITCQVSLFRFPGATALPGGVTVKPF